MKKKKLIAIHTLFYPSMIFLFSVFSFLVSLLRMVLIVMI